MKMSRVNWKNLDSVIAYCKTLSKPPKFECIVVKHKNRSNYNITHASRTDLYTPDMVVWKG